MASRHAPSLNLTLAAAAVIVLAGCAGPQGSERNPDDPWEGMNRGVYQFNDTVDRYAFKPVAQVYTTVVPQVARNCIHNVFSNAGDLWAGFNSFLQGRGHDFINTLGRFLLNTTMGLGGCIDIASTTGANKIPNDFGTTLGVWGFPQGPYLVLPLLGPSTVRDGTGMAANYFGNVLSPSNIENVRLRNSVWGLDFVQTRAGLLDTTNLVDDVALDPYSFVRDAYLQRRKSMVLGKEGAAGALPVYEDFGDDDEPVPTAPTPKP